MIFQTSGLSLFCENLIFFLGVEITTSAMNLRFLGECGGVDGLIIAASGIRLGVGVHAEDRERVEYLEEVPLSWTSSMRTGIGTTGRASASSSDSHMRCTSSSSESDSTVSLALPRRFFVLPFGLPFFPVLCSSPFPCS